MTRSRQFKRLTRMVAGTLMSVAAHTFCTPSVVLAGCGHGVDPASAAIFRLYQFDELVMTGASLLPDYPSPLSSSGPKTPGRRNPCWGLSCSGRVPLPVPTTSSSHDRSDRWVTLAALSGTDITSPPVRKITERSPRPVGQTIAIFHPPRT